ncbi:Sir2 family NAD-dependent protein deacetylase [Sporolactobacillus sp. THM19-2]|jgi:NAD-dependent deacetylase|uniref:SIR2 family NAD-dependent protein deacylase n=1 Tax=Sporolactobacillus sp. THM19-2 TaxID=2511171 RepID=UPI00101F820D|nr:Sir2 family NAD-dependent protein deacetylase [Sporolactobacillus sp. THM19-2]RYL93348.1 NAD-dependent deacetylase [Sporolactobacillus sp. THM19-2]
MKSINQLLEKDRNIVVLTGAGVSVPSGIPPFRGPDGLYQNNDVERFLTMNYYLHQPEKFWNFYWNLFDADLLLTAKPNNVHRWIQKLEDKHNVTVITQNIDGLHVRAGSSHVIEIHGSFTQTVCPSCGTVYATGNIRNQKVPHCSARNEKGGTCGHILKPDIVLFGEAVYGFNEAEAALNHADRLLILGTSLGVAPANMIPYYAKKKGVPTLLVNDRPAIQMDCVDRYIQADFRHFDPDQPTV